MIILNATLVCSKNMILLVSLTFNIFIVCLQKVEDALQKGTDFSSQGFILEEDPEYQLIVDCGMGYIVSNLSVVVSSVVASKMDFCFGVLIVHGMCSEF